MPAAQTIRQAKASFAARGRPSLNAQEQRQLERGLELEQRAEKAKEAERRRAAAAKKRAENESKSKHDREKALLGTQRRKDRFGYVSSQFHMGAFLVGGGKRKVEEDKELPRQKDDEDDLFGDDGLDDEVMLNALDAPPAEHAKSDSAMFIPVIAPPTMKRSQSAPVMDDLMDDFWDDMETSTQIARELGDSEVKADMEMEMTGKSRSTRSASFGSVDFDLTAEDLDHLDPPRKEEIMPVKMIATPLPPPAKKELLMPPPAVPTRPIQHTPQSRMSKVQPPQSKSSTTTMRPPSSKPASAMPPPSKSVQKMPPPMKPAAKPPISNPQISTTVNAPQPQKAAILPPSRRLQHHVPQQTKSRAVIKGECFHMWLANDIRTDSSLGPFLPASSLYCSPDLGFTLTQLESFVDDDIQLTQAMPG